MASPPLRYSLPVLLIMPLLMAATLGAPEEEMTSDYDYRDVTTTSGKTAGAGGDKQPQIETSPQNTPQVIPNTTKSEMTLKTSTLKLAQGSTDADNVIDEPTPPKRASTPPSWDIYGTSDAVTENPREKELHRKIFFAVLGICVTASVSLFLIFLLMLIYARSHGWHKTRRSDTVREESIFMPRSAL